MATFQVILDGITGLELRDCHVQVGIAGFPPVWTMKCTSTSSDVPIDTIVHLPVAAIFRATICKLDDIVAEGLLHVLPLVQGRHAFETKLPLHSTKISTSFLHLRLRGTTPYAPSESLLCVQDARTVLSSSTNSLATVVMLHEGRAVAKWSSDRQTTVQCVKSSQAEVEVLVFEHWVDGSRQARAFVPGDVFQRGTIEWPAEVIVPMDAPNVELRLYVFVQEARQSSALFDEVKSPIQYMPGPGRLLLKVTQSRDAAVCAIPAAKWTATMSSSDQAEIKLHWSPREKQVPQLFVNQARGLCLAAWLLQPAQPAQLVVDGVTLEIQFMPNAASHGVPAADVPPGDIHVGLQELAFKDDVGATAVSVRIQCGTAVAQSSVQPVVKKLAAFHETLLCPKSSLSVETPLLWIAVVADGAEVATTCTPLFPYVVSGHLATLTLPLLRDNERVANLTLELQFLPVVSLPRRELRLAIHDIRNVVNWWQTIQVECKLDGHEVMAEREVVEPPLLLTLPPCSSQDISIELKQGNLVLARGSIAMDELNQPQRWHSFGTIDVLLALSETLRRAAIGRLYVDILEARVQIPWENASMKLALVQDERDVPKPTFETRQSSAIHPKWNESTVLNVVSFPCFLYCGLHSRASKTATQVVPCHANLKDDWIQVHAGDLHVADVHMRSCYLPLFQGRLRVQIHRGSGFLPIVAGTWQPHVELRLPSSYTATTSQRTTPSRSALWNESIEFTLSNKLETALPPVLKVQVWNGDVEIGACDVNLVTTIARNAHRDWFRLQCDGECAGFLHLSMEFKAESDVAESPDDKKTSLDQLVALKKLFYSLDTDKSGFIETNELRRVMESNAALKKCVAGNVQKLLELFDADEDGRVSFEEYVAGTRRFQNLGEETAPPTPNAVKEHEKPEEEPSNALQGQRTKPKTRNAMALKPNGGAESPMSKKKVSEKSSRARKEEQQLQLLKSQEELPDGAVSLQNDKQLAMMREEIQRLRSVNRDLVQTSSSREDVEALGRLQRENTQLREKYAQAKTQATEAQRLLQVETARCHRLQASLEQLSKPPGTLQPASSRGDGTGRALELELAKLAEQAKLREEERMKKTVASTKLQSRVRARLQQRQYQATKLQRNEAAVLLQAVLRGWKTRRRFRQSRRQHRAAICIQTQFRRHVVRQSHGETADAQQVAAVMIQSQWRRCQAQKRLGNDPKLQCQGREQPENAVGDAIDGRSGSHASEKSVLHDLDDVLNVKTPREDGSSPTDGERDEPTCHEDALPIASDSHQGEISMETLPPTTKEAQDERSEEKDGADSAWKSLGSSFVESKQSNRVDDSLAHVVDDLASEPSDDAVNRTTDQVARELSTSTMERIAPLESPSVDASGSREVDQPVQVQAMDVSSREEHSQERRDGDKPTLSQEDSKNDRGKSEDDRASSHRDVTQSEQVERSSGFAASSHELNDGQALESMDEVTALLQPRSDALDNLQAEEQQFHEDMMETHDAMELSEKTDASTEPVEPCLSEPLNQVESTSQRCGREEETTETCGDQGESPTKDNDDGPLAMDNEDVARRLAPPSSQLMEQSDDREATGMDAFAAESQDTTTTDTPTYDGDLLTKDNESVESYEKAEEHGMATSVVLQTHDGQFQEETQVDGMDVPLVGDSLEQLPPAEPVDKVSSAASLSSQDMPQIDTVTEIPESCDGVEPGEEDELGDCHEPHSKTLREEELRASSSHQSMELAIATGSSTLMALTLSEQPAEQPEHVSTDESNDPSMADGQSSCINPMDRSSSSTYLSSQVVEQATTLSAFHDEEPHTTAHSFNDHAEFSSTPAADSAPGLSDDACQSTNDKTSLTPLSIHETQTTAAETIEFQGEFDSEPVAFSPPGDTATAASREAIQAIANEDDSCSLGEMESSLQRRMTTAPASVQPTLKVMRLYKPRLSMEKTYRREFALSNMLLLPDSFGNIYLGETFSSYISVINQFACDLHQVGLTAKLQTPTSRSDLLDKRSSRGGATPPMNPTPTLSAGSNLDMAVEYELNEVGVHTLRVGVTYLDPLTSEPKSLRKFYRFQVLNPLTITFKHVLIKEESYVEAKIHNITQTPLHIDTIEFVPSPPFQAHELAADSKSLVLPEDAIQRTFKVTAAAHVDLNAGAMNLGRLEVAWMSAMGEAGRMQTQPVVRKVASAKEASVSIILPDPCRAVVGEPFVATFVIENHTTRPMHLQLQLRRELMVGVLCSSLSHQVRRLSFGKVDALRLRTSASSERMGA
ncbi:unnamed protein product [Aphanomyces euteiches]